ncbi:dfdf domain-containing protein [Lichtheimia corymbifera JMRC:FSU:9682]|uniref:Dfdf domain-containing protein n=1 Tax=Lichtheimia corymbifera JMRC:FSU:9682 TaxID=1263082 RepID=A0A068RNY4_9FUNG|nr:dfdf domain-containing protein [Lichtheimia corymbifera JMRC:FSU:9682]
MADYVGISLQVTLVGGVVITGVVGDLDANTRNMTLKSVAICPPGGPVQFQDMLIVSGSQIQDLKIVPTSTPQQQQQQQPTAPAAASYPHPHPHPPPTANTPPNKVQDTPMTSMGTDATPKPMSSTSQTSSKPAMSIVDPAIVHIGSVSPEQVKNKFTPTAPAAAVIATPSPPTSAAVTNKPNEVTHSPHQTQSTTASTTPSKQKGLLFGANRQSNKPRKLIVEPEIFDYRDFSRGKKGKRAAAPAAIAGTKADTESSSPETATKQSSTTSSKPAASTTTTSTSPKQKNENGVLNVEATASLNSLLNTTSSSASSSPRKLSQADVSIPASLIPPKARAMANGNSSTSTTKKATATTTSPTSSSSQSLKPVQILKPNKQTQQKQSSSKQPSKKVEQQQKPKSAESSPKQPDDVVANEQGGLVIKTAAHGIQCPIVTPEQMRQVEEICQNETGPNEEMMVENAGHGASMMALKALGGGRRIQPDNHNAAPVAVIFAGNNKVGSYSLSAARHLANRGCHVYIVMTYRKDRELESVVATQKKCAEFAGVQVVDDVDSLPEQQTTPVDLIIDAMMGSELSLSMLRNDYETREILWKAMDWANANKAPVLSLDFPSGINALDGHPFHVMHHIQPKWTLCFGAPKQGCTSRAITGELFLADMGIPSASWRKAGINRCKIPWGADFILALEYGS